MNSSVLLEAESVSKTYNPGRVRVEAVRGVSLSIAEGEHLSIIGPSGCGKSTLLYLLGALITPTSGRVIINGRPTGDLGDRALTEIRRRSIGFVFQQFNLIPTLTARENLRIALRLRGVHDEDRIRRCLESVGLKDKMGRRPNELSVGEQQRVSIARALVCDPGVILADEPTGSLDSRTSAGITDLFARLNRENGRTLVIVTHNAEIANSAGRTLHMIDGRISG
jgi:putative ABC transport system ATP-binding protein